MITAQRNLAQAWAQLKEREPKLRIRNAAKELGVSEAELLALQTNEGVTPLRSDFKGILLGIPALGHVMALTRNEHVVHERKGTYNKPSFHGHVGLVVGEDIDLRLFMEHWKFAFAVDQEERRSIQFFNKEGMAVHKIYLTPKSNREAWYALIDQFTSEEAPLLELESIPAPEPEKPDSEIDVAGFQKAWSEMTDTHQFFGMLKEYGVTRTQAFRLAPEGFTKKVGNKALREVFTHASSTGLEIMVFVGNNGNIQIHTGPVKRLLDHGTWFNVMDPKFNLHLNEPAITETWVVKKPTEDGMVHSLEIFDAQGENIAMIFGKRKPGIPELPEWTALIEAYFGQ